MNNELLSFVLAGQLRQDIVKLLAKPKTPSQLTKELETQDSSISRALKELESEGIIECLFPEKRKGRLYRLTNEGEQVLDHL